MSDTLWNNLLTYALQVGLLIAIAGWIPAAALGSPKARLVFFQALLAACLLLPFVRPWKTERFVIEQFTATPHVSTPVKPKPQPIRIDPRGYILAALAVGAAVRLAMLALGMLRLRRYRLHSAPMGTVETSHSEAEIRLSEEVTGPVTFGLLNPVILLPAHFPHLPEEMREAILCHEAVHVSRCDWLFAVGEELIRAGLWFHPAIWWLLGEIQLAREQTVDREAVDVTKARERYVDALLAAAGATIEPDLAPAPLFLRKRHLKQRVVSILKEKRMSKKRTVSTLAASLALLAGACWYLTGALPLLGDPQMAPDSPGITVELMGSQLMHRAPVHYPTEALQNRVEGVVVAQVSTDVNGDVTDAKVLSGPDELRKAALESLLEWHFTKDAAGSMRQVAITFRLPQAPEAQEGAAGGAALPRTVSAGNAAPSITVTAPPLPRTTPMETRKSANPIPENATIRSISVEGMGVPADQITSKLPVHVGDALSADNLKALTEALHSIDSHLNFGFSSDAQTRQVDIRIRPANSAPPPAPPQPSSITPPAGAITVAGDLMTKKLVSQVAPVYPQLARQARISGVIQLAAVIGPDGRVQELRVLSGHPLMRQAALDAVRQWVYEPTYLNGKPVAVSTTINAVFSIDQN